MINSSLPPFMMSVWLMNRVSRILPFSLTSLIKPASQGTGIIAGGPVRAVVELAGYRDILSKCIGSRTPINMVRATMQGLASLKTVNEVAELREKTVDEIFG